MDGMRILVAYDGTDNADAALASLRRAGLPEVAEAIVLTISDIWVPTAIELSQLDDDDDDVIVESGRAVRALRHARQTASDAAARLRGWFPRWSVRYEARSDTPAWGILEKASAWTPDLIVVGTHGRSIVGRMLLGSVSQKVVNESKCSVHIGREADSPFGPTRLVVGIDGSDDADAAVEEIARRSWPFGCEVHLVSAYAPLDLHYAPTAITLPNDRPGNVDDDVHFLRKRIEAAAETLEARGVRVARSVRIGVPVPVLLDEAEMWQADAIMLGARGHGMIERILLGSVSSAIAARAPCSVGVIRPRG